MEEYFNLLDKVAERLARKADQGEAIAFNLERIERILNIAEREIETVNKAG